MPVYVFNFEDNNGFAIVSGDNRDGLVLALTENGNIREGMENDNPGLAIFLERLEIYYEEAIRTSQFEETSSSSGIGNSVPSYTRSSETGGGGGGGQLPGPTEWVYDQVYGEIIPAKWGQGSPYNSLCPGQHLAGCVPVAVAQIMYHHGYPPVYVNFAPNRFPPVYENIILNWTEMKKHKHTGSEGNYPNAHYMIARLIQLLGDYLDVDYGADGSGADSEDVNNALWDFEYNAISGLTDYNALTILAEVINNRPVYVRGNAIKEVHKFLGITTLTDYHGGHAWVIDAVLRQNKVVGGRMTGVFRDLVHCNWGWNGLHNGFYISNAFDTREGAGIIVEDEDVENMTRGSNRYGESYNYQYKIKMLTGIYPKN